MPPRIDIVLVHRAGVSGNARNSAPFSPTANAADFHGPVDATDPTDGRGGYRLTIVPRAPTWRVPQCRSERFVEEAGYRIP